APDGPDDDPGCTCTATSRLSAAPERGSPLPGCAPLPFPVAPAFAVDAKEVPTTPTTANSTANLPRTSPSSSSRTAPASPHGHSPPYPVWGQSAARAAARHVGLGMPAALPSPTCE